MRTLQSIPSDNEEREGPLKIELHSLDCGPLTSNNGNSPGLLKPDERHQLEKCENVLRRGLGTFFEVGEALLTIKKEELYRQEFPTFAAYCDQRWGIGRHYAWHLMGAAARVKLLPDNDKIPKPANEFQVRPFLKLDPELFPKAWEQVISRAKNGKITPALLRGIVAQMLPQKGASRFEARKRKANRLPAGCSAGAILIQLSGAKRSAESGNIAEVLETLARIESELLGLCRA